MKQVKAYLLARLVLSLPVRERGLKQKSWQRIFCQFRSLPVRERGLKPLELDLKVVDKLSLPVRERGLKHLLSICGALLFLVAPRAGAWIETPIH